jgi:hypothetical protein
VEADEARQLALSHPRRPDRVLDPEAERVDQVRANAHPIMTGGARDHHQRDSCRAGRPEVDVVPALAAPDEQLAAPGGADPAAHDLTLLGRRRRRLGRQLPHEWRDRRRANPERTRDALRRRSRGTHAAHLVEQLSIRHAWIAARPPDGHANAARYRRRVTHAAYDPPDGQ